MRRLARAFDPRFIVPTGLKAWFAGSRDHQCDRAELGRARRWSRVCTVRVHAGPARRRAVRSRIRGGGSGRRGRRSAPSASTSAAIPATTGISRTQARRWAPSTSRRSPSAPIRRGRRRVPVHLNPEEALQAWDGSPGATTFLGIHWGTYALAREPYDEPPRPYRRRGGPPRACRRSGSGRRSPGSPSTGRPARRSAGYLGRARFPGSLRSARGTGRLARRCRSRARRGRRPGLRQRARRCCSTGWGYEVAEAADGREALDRAIAFRPSRHRHRSRDARDGRARPARGAPRRAARLVRDRPHRPCHHRDRGVRHEGWAPTTTSPSRSTSAGSAPWWTRRSRSRRSCAR